MKQRVVVTGLGVVSPVGLDVASSWSSILAGRSGVVPITDFDASGFRAQIAAPVKDFDPTLYLSAKEARRNDLFIQYGFAAASQALRQAGLDQMAQQDPALADRMGVFLGSGIGGLPLIEETHHVLQTQGARRISPFFVPGGIINMVAGLVAIHYGLRGPNLSTATACASATHAIGLAARLIAYGDADVMVAGGAEKASSPLGIGGFSAMQALSTRNDAPTAASRPFDAGRDGFVLGDGAGALVLESYAHAVARGATILAELTGFGMSDDATHITAPPENGEGAARAMQHALRDAGLASEAIDYINAHGTSTPVGDIAESRAIESVFGQHAFALAVSSTKSMTGHLLGAAGAVEAVFSILALRDQIAPPTINLDQPDPACRLDYVPNQARSLSIRHVMSNSFGFGGT
ncbi:MAG: beta-ketoacyl-ACP synthase II, partial [Pseudomonadota bacterium]|nr:beta-ketoacyl-ACP synthase II [Pseudomonadota bacterium]